MFRSFFGARSSSDNASAGSAAGAGDVAGLNEKQVTEGNKSPPKSGGGFSSGVGQKDKVLSNRIQKMDTIIR